MQMRLLLIKYAPICMFTENKNVVSGWILKKNHSLWRHFTEKFVGKYIFKILNQENNTRRSKKKKKKKVVFGIKSNVNRHFINSSVMSFELGIEMKAWLWFYKGDIHQETNSSWIYSVTWIWSGRSLHFGYRCVRKMTKTVN